MNKWYVRNIKTAETTIFFGPNFWVSMPRQFQKELEEICNAHNRELVQVAAKVADLETIISQQHGPP